MASDVLLQIYPQEITWQYEAGHRLEANVQLRNSSNMPVLVKLLSRSEHDYMFAPSSALVLRPWAPEVISVSCGPLAAVPSQRLDSIVIETYRAVDGMPLSVAMLNQPGSHKLKLETSQNLPVHLVASAPSALPPPPRSPSWTAPASPSTSIGTPPSTHAFQRPPPISPSQRGKVGWRRDESGVSGSRGGSSAAAVAAAAQQGAGQMPVAVGMGMGVGAMGMMAGRGMPVDALESELRIREEALQELGKNLAQTKLALAEYKDEMARLRIQNQSLQGQMEDKQLFCSLCGNDRQPDGSSLGSTRSDGGWWNDATGNNRADGEAVAMRMRNLRRDLEQAEWAAEQAGANADRWQRDNDILRSQIKTLEARLEEAVQRDAASRVELVQLLERVEDLEAEHSKLIQDSEEMQSNVQQSQLFEGQARMHMRMLKSELEAEKRACADAKREIADIQLKKVAEQRRLQAEMLQLRNENSRLQNSVESVQKNDTSKLYYIFQLVTVRAEKERLKEKVTALQEQVKTMEAAAGAAAAAAKEAALLRESGRSYSMSQASLGAPTNPFDRFSPSRPVMRDGSGSSSSSSSIISCCSSSSSSSSSSSRVHNEPGMEDKEVMAVEEKLKLSEEKNRLYEKQVEQLDSELAKLRAELVQMRCGLEEATAQSERMEREKELAEREKAAALEEVERLRKGLGPHSGDDAQVEEVLDLSPDDARAQLREANDQLGRERQHSSVLQRNLMDANRKLQSIKKEKDQLTSKLQNAEELFNTYKTGVENLKAQLIENLCTGQPQTQELEQHHLLSVVLHMHEELERQQHHNAQLQHELSQSATRGWGPGGEVAKLQAELNTCKEELAKADEKLKKTRQEMQRSVSQLHKKLEETKKQLEEAQQQQNQQPSPLQQDAALTAAEVQAMASRISELERKVAEEQQRWEESEHQRLQTETEKEEVEAELEELRHTKSGLQRRLAEAERNALRSHSARLEQMRLELQRRQDQADALAGGEKREREKRMAAEGRVVQLQESLKELQTEVGDLKQQLTETKLKADQDSLLLEEKKEECAKLEREKRDAEAKTTADKLEILDPNPKKRGHVLRLRTKPSYNCGQCFQRGSGNVWKCNSCHEYIHPECMLQR